MTSTQTDNGITSRAEHTHATFTQRAVWGYLAGGRRAGARVSVLRGSCGNREEWIETLTYGETCGRVEQNVIFEDLRDGF